MTCEVRHTITAISTDTSNPQQTVEVYSIEFDFSDWDPHWGSLVASQPTPLTGLWLDQYTYKSATAVSAVGPHLVTIPPNYVSDPNNVFASTYRQGYLEEQTYDGLGFSGFYFPKFTRRIYHCWSNRVSNIGTGALLFPLSAATRAFLDNFSNIVGLHSFAMENGGSLRLVADPLLSAHWLPVVDIWSLPRSAGVGGGPLDANGWRPQFLGNPNFPGYHDQSVVATAWSLPQIAYNPQPSDTTMTPQYYRRQLRRGYAYVGPAGLFASSGGDVSFAGYSYIGDQVAYRICYTDLPTTGSLISGTQWLYRKPENTYQWNAAAAVDTFWDPAAGWMYFDYSAPPGTRALYETFNRCTIRPYISTYPAQDLQPGGGMVPGMLWVP